MKYVYLCLFIQFSFSVFSQNEVLNQKIDQMLTKEYADNETGATILVSKADEIIYQKAFGMANVELAVPSTIDHVFQIASMTKQFTAVSILILMEEGKLDLGDPISTYLNNFPGGDHITIHHLLTHTSGISRNITVNPWDRLMLKKDFTPLEFIDYFKEEPKVSEAGEAYLYNNFGYIMLGAIIEKISNLSYESFLNQKIFVPLAMHNSYVKKDHQLIKNRVSGYTKDDGQLTSIGYYSPSQLYAAGGIMSTVKDLFRWHQAIRNNELISKESKELAFTNHKLNNGSNINYGYGWFIQEVNGLESIEHAGSQPGFGSNGVYLPEPEVYVVLFNNCDCTHPKYVSNKIAALVAGKPYDEPTVDFEPDIDELQKWVGQYTFNNGSQRSIYMNENHLYYILPNGTEIKMLPGSNNKFYLENTFTRIDFKLEGNTLVHMRTKNGKSEKLGVKEYLQHEQIDLSTKKMKKFEGEYQLFPGFTITITLREDQLKSIGTGQEPLDIFPESPSRFFYKSIDAYIDFNLNEEGICTSIALTQDGKTYAGTRIN